MEVRYKGYMNRRHGLIRHSVLCLQTLSSIIFAVALITGQLSWAATSPVTIGGPFTLIASNGTTVTDQTFRGKWLLVYFGYTFCPNTCPMTLNEIATALEKLGTDAAKMQPLFITVDPQRDTREVLEQYTQSFDPRIVGLTGNPEQIAAVAKEYGVYWAAHKTGPAAEDYVMDHSSYLYVMDPEGKFVRAFDADTPGDRVADALRELMARPREGGSQGCYEPDDAIASCSKWSLRGTIGYRTASGGRLMNYDEFFADAIGRLWREWRYRVFWCSNDYLWRQAALPRNQSGATDALESMTVEEEKY